MGSLPKQLVKYAEKVSTIPKGYAQTNIPYIIHLNSSGEFKGLSTTSDGANGKKDRGKKYDAPFVRKGIAVAPCLLVDNAEYVLGAPTKKRRSEPANPTFIALIQECAEVTKEPTVEAVRVLYEEKIGKMEWDEVVTYFELSEDFDTNKKISFSVSGEMPFELDSVKTFWAEKIGTKRGTEAGICMVCGKDGALVSSIEKKVKGLRGGQASGLYLFSSNRPAFKHYGSGIPPICYVCSEKMMDGVNVLVADESTRIHINKGTYLFWTKDGNESIVSLFKEPDLVRVQELIKSVEVRELIKSVESGERTYYEVNETDFYFLVLAANGGRAVVRDWLEDLELRNVKENIARYFRYQEMEGTKPLSLLSLTMATIRFTGKMSEIEKINQIVPDALFRFAIKGTPIPLYLARHVLNRIYIENNVWIPQRQLALAKMILLSNTLPKKSKYERSELMVELNQDKESMAYLCGRIFVTAERIQYAVNPNIKHTVRDRLFKRTAIYPVDGMRRVLTEAEAHLKKLRRDKPGLSYTLDRELAELASKLSITELKPMKFSLEEQLEFVLSCHYQRSHNFAMMKEAQARKEEAQVVDEAA